MILSSDNGPVLDDGYQDKAVELLGSHKPAGPFRGGKYSVFEGGTRMPFIVRWARHVRPGVSDAIVSQVDFVASFAALTGQTLGPDDAPDSFNVLPALLGQSRTGRTSYVEYGDTLARRHGNWKYIPPSSNPPYDPNTQTALGASKFPQLYDLANEAGEKHNVAAEHPEIVSRLAAELDRIVKEGRSRP